MQFKDAAYELLKEGASLFTTAKLPISPCRKVFWILQGSLRTPQTKCFKTRKDPLGL